jgi:sialidase-1
VNASLLLAFAEGRQQRTDHGIVDLVLKHSVDGGASWSALSLIHSSSHASRAGGRGTVGNPAPLLDGDEIVLFFCIENREIHSTRSADFGASWSVPAQIGWAPPSHYMWVATGPPAALVTSSSRWVLPCDGLTGSRQIWKAERAFSFVLLSDDRGATWRQSAELDGGNECQAAQLPNGSLVLNMRSKVAARLHSLSSDDGESWSTPRKATPPVSDANCQVRAKTDRARAWPLHPACGLDWTGA